MYSRSYNDEQEGFEFHNARIPTGYDGTALATDGGEEKREICDECCQKPRECDSKRGDGGKGGSSLLDGVLKLLGGGHFGFSLSNIDNEDLLLIGLALFLFFSKNHDRECALMIAALLFIR